MEEFVLVEDFLQGDFVLKYLPFLKWEINYYGAEKSSIDVIDVALEKDEGLPTRSELFILIFLAPG